MVHSIPLKFLPIPMVLEGQKIDNSLWQIFLRMLQIPMQSPSCSLTHVQFSVTCIFSCKWSKNTIPMFCFIEFLHLHSYAFAVPTIFLCCAPNRPLMDYTSQLSQPLKKLNMCMHADKLVQHFVLLILALKLIWQTKLAAEHRNDSPRWQDYKQQRRYMVTRAARLSYCVRVGSSKVGLNTVR